MVFNFHHKKFKGGKNTKLYILKNKKIIKIELLLINNINVIILKNNLLLF